MMRIDPFVRVAGVVGAALLGAAALSAQQSAPPTPGPGLDLINERCGYCHTPNQVFAARKTSAEWPAIVQSMIDRGAELTPEEQKVMNDYLVATLATDRKAAGAAGH
ncbi:hypothetical protein [Sphingomonas endophytica]|nr:hypothetical protein [Sphingomonas endophytica]